MKKIFFSIAVFAFLASRISPLGEQPTLQASYAVSDSDLDPQGIVRLTDWVPVPEKGINQGFSPKHFYFNLTISNGAEPFHGILDVPFNRLRRVDLIETDRKGIFTVIKNGADLPMSARPLRYAAAAFPVDLEPGATRRFYLHVATDTAVKIPLRLLPVAAFLHEQSQSLLMYGIYAGLLALMVVYNLILFWAFRQKSYLFYLMNNIAGLIYYLTFDGIWGTYVLPEAPRAAHATLAIASLFHAGAYLIFIVQFAPLKERSIWLDRTVWITGWALIAMGALGHLIIPPGQMNQLSINLAFASIFLGFLANILVPARGNLALRWFKTGNIILILCAVIFIFFFWGILPDNFLVRNSLRIGTLLELISFSLALATRIRTIDDNRKSAEVMAEARTQFAANVSHEIRTPLTAIVGITDLLSETELNGQQAKYVKSLQSATQALHALANDVLTFAKLDSDKMRVEEVAFSPAELIQRTFEIYRYKAAEKKIELSYEAPPGDIHLMGDPTKIGQILNNLIGNALKFTEYSGSVRIVGTVAAIANKQMFQVKVTDNGIGIPKEKLSGLFAAYTQAEDSTERLYGGTGLGLHISHQLAKLMNGSLEAESHEGAGSTFTLTLYLDLAPAILSQAQIDYARLVRQMPRALKILHIDDQADIRMLFQFYFANTQHQIDSAESAEEGIELYKKHQYDFVFSDIHMPGMGGIKGLEAIRAYAQEQHLSPHLILCSGSMDPHEMLGKNVRILLKPIRTRDVYGAIVEMSAAS